MNLDINLPLVFSILGLHLLAVMSPGPDFVLVTKNSLTYSRKTGIYTALGIALGLTIHLSYSLAGLGLILTHNMTFYQVLQILGGLYLAYIGIFSLIAAFKKSKIKEIKRNKIEIMSATKAIKMGFITNLFNPKVGLFFISLFSQFLEKNVSSLTKASVAISLTFITFIYFSLVSFGITIPHIKNIYFRCEYLIEAFFALALLILSVNILIHSFS